MDKPLVTFVTRCCWRPQMLTDAIQSVQNQTRSCWEHLFLVDEQKRGLQWANKQFHRHREHVQGEYVFILDDDGRLEDPCFVACLEAFVYMRDYPDVVLTQSLAPAPGGGFHYLPLAHVWAVDWGAGERPEKWAGHAYNYVVRADVWKDTIEAFGKAPRTGGDAFFGTALCQGDYRIEKMDRVVAKSMQRGRARVFESCRPNWWQVVVRRFGIQQVEGDVWRLP